MKRLVFIVEGQTEQEFIDEVVRKYFVEEYEYHLIDVYCIETSVGHKGGFAKYSHLKNNILRALRAGEVTVTTFLDFFRIPKTTPNYEEMLKIPNLFIDKKIEKLEEGITDDINDYRLIPYIQKHEFEALLFSDNCGFEEMYDDEDIPLATQKIIDQYPNPEEINNNPTTAPSKRLMKILEDSGGYYDKVTEGCLIAEDIGMTKILAKCPRFRAWIERLVQEVTT